jgi:hypothetical protein
LAADAAKDTPAVVESVGEVAGPNGALTPRHILAQVGVVGPVNAPNTVGTFDLTMTNVPIFRAADAKALGVLIGDKVVGYQVTYNLAPNFSIKPGCSLILVQALECGGAAAQSAEFDSAAGAAKTALPSYAAAAGNAAAIAFNTNTRCVLRDRPFNPRNPNHDTTWTIDVCAVEVDPSMSPPTETILGGVSFTWFDQKNNAVLTLPKPGNPQLAPFNTIYETPGHKLGVGSSISTIGAGRPTSTFADAMKDWNPLWPALKP